MDLTKLISFSNVANTGSFTKTAQLMFCTQSAVTQQIKALELELDCQLFIRNKKKRIILTPEGYEFLQYANFVQKNHDKMISRLNEMKGQKKGKLTIAAPFTTLNQLLPEKINKYIKNYPWVEMTLLDQPHHRIVELVNDGYVDIGITLNPAALKSRMEVIKWMRVETVLLTPKEHPLTKLDNITLQDITCYPLILPPRHSADSRYQKLIQLLHENNLEYKVAMESSNVELSAVYVEMGLGVCFATVVNDLPALKKRQIEVIPLSDFFNPDYIAILILKESDFPPYRKAFIDIVLN